ncbi:MAG: ABC transporter ATP-binding protein [Proteobacteria bacterium]|nr:ABC transporter ATP-binding protein [Pseudomonadota bacterium]MDA1299784.1 ABC transporter ATP-binding protein [Pseudomonadota bacterium]
MSEISRQPSSYSYRLHKTSDEESLTPKAFVRLFLRTWPYLKPQWKHLLVWSSARFLIEIIWVFAALVAFDLFNNKVLVGEKLESSQVTLLFLDDSYRSYVPDQTNETVEQEQGEAPMLTRVQRAEVRDRLLILFGIAGVFIFMLSPAIDYYRTWILQRVNQFLRVTMVERAEHLSLRYHSNARTGDAIYRLYQDSAMITSVIERILLEPLVAIGQVFFSFFVLCLFSPVLGLMFIGGIIPMVWLIVWYTPRLQIRSRRARTTNSDLTSRIQEGFAAIRIIKANRADPILRQRFNQDSRTALDAAFYLRVESILMRMLLMLLVGLMMIATQYLTAGWTMAEDPTFLAGSVALVGFTIWNFGAFQAVQSRTSEFLLNGMDLVRIWTVLQDMSVGLDRSFFLLDLEPDVVDDEDAVPIPEPILKITYTDVTFGYDPDRPILKGINLAADVGTITAIVGTTGSGKSTLMSLLLRLYDPDSGSIAINGIDLTHLQIDSLRAGVAIALQQNTLFATSVADNIAYATADVDRAAIEAAARVACADEFIRTMAQGYDTELGERGGKLSTGQRQRLSIARAVVRDTPILILDEPTASLDAETEHRVLANLAEWGRQRIVFVITHRLSTIRNADQIAFLEDGEIVELGNHETLMAISDGRYRRFVSAEVEVTSASESVQ